MLPRSISTANAHLMLGGVCTVRPRRCLDTRHFFAKNGQNTNLSTKVYLERRPVMPQGKMVTPQGKMVAPQGPS